MNTNVLVWIKCRKAELYDKRKTLLNTKKSTYPISMKWHLYNSSFPVKDTPLPSNYHSYDLSSSPVRVTLDLIYTHKCSMSRVEAFRDTNLRSLLRELRTDIAMAVDDPFPLVYGLADKNIITDQLLKVRHARFDGNLNLMCDIFFSVSVVLFN